MRSIGVFHFKNINIRFIDRHAFEGSYRNTIKFVSAFKSAITHILQFEIGFYFFFIQIVLFGTQFISIVCPIPSFQFLSGTFFVHHLL